MGDLLKKTQVDENYYASMADLKIKFTKDIKRVLTIIIGFLVVMFIFQYYSMREQAINTLSNLVSKTSYNIDTSLSNLEYQNNLMKTYAETRLKRQNIVYEESELKSTFIYNDDTNIFSLSKASSLISFDTAGDVLGLGEVDKNDKKRMDELKMALELFDIDYYSSDVNSINRFGFYLSESNFITTFSNFTNDNIGSID